MRSILSFLYGLLVLLIFMGSAGCRQTHILSVDSQSESQIAAANERLPSSQFKMVFANGDSTRGASIRVVGDSLTWISPETGEHRYRRLTQVKSVTYHNAGHGALVGAGIGLGMGLIGGGAWVAHMFSNVTDWIGPSPLMVGGMLIGMVAVPSTLVGAGAGALLHRDRFVFKDPEEQPSDK